MRLLPVTFREANINDAEKLGYIHYKSWIETYTGLIHPDFLASRSIKKSTAIFSENKCKNIILASDNENPIGFCGFGNTRDPDLPKNFGEIYGIYVLRSYQHMSIGHQLISSALIKLKGYGYTDISLWVLKDNIKAIKFYEKLQFHFDGNEKECLLGSPVTEKRYTRKL